MLVHRIRLDIFSLTTVMVASRSVPTVVLEDVEVLGLYDVIRLAGYAPVLCLLPLHHWWQIDWSRYGEENPRFFGYDH